MSVNCPGFKPHGVKPTRCRKCFKEYSEHIKNGNDLNERKQSATKSESKDDSNSALTPTMTVESEQRNKTMLSNSSSAKTSDSASSLSMSRLAANQSTAQTNNSSLNSSVGKSQSERGDDSANKGRVRTRVRELQIPESNSHTSQSSSSSSTSARRARVRPASMTDMEPIPMPSTSFATKTTDIAANQSRTRLRQEPDGAEQSASEKTSASQSVKSKNTSPKIIKIIAAEEVENKLSLPIDSDVHEKTSSDVEFILRVKTASQSKEFDEDSIAATDTTETTLVGCADSIDDLQTRMTALMSQIEKAEERVKSLEKENSDLKTQMKKSDKLNDTKARVSDTDRQALGKTADELLKLRTRVRELETANTDLKDKNNVLKIEVKELNNEVTVLKKDNPKELKETVTNLRLKLQQTENVCEQLSEENDEMKKDVKALEEEFQELHDNFREDQTSEFRVLKRELESTSKNCRILQFKLKKAERSLEMLDNEKLELEKKVKDLLETTKLDFDKHRMKELETELSIAKEVSLKLHAEIEVLKEERIQMEKQINDSSKTLFPTPSAKSANRLSAGNLSPSVSFESKDYEAVVRDLYDTMEREKDLQEQMKFTEEEVRTMRKKLSTMEQENEILMMQIRKMANQNRVKPNDKDEDDEELSVEEMKLHLELYEQEMVVLRRKTDELEQENDNFQTEIKYLQEKLVSQPLAKVEIPEIPVGSPPNVIYEHKIRILEGEARELRKKLVDREKENESLRTEIDVHRRKASKVIIRSRSLDSNEQIDLKRQLQLVEQEASILRQKIMSLEADNDRLANDNKRFQLRLSRKPPPGPADQLQIENLELNQKVQDLERRCDHIKGELAASKSHPSLGNLFLTNTESDVINTLKKQLKSKETEVSALNSKAAQLDVELNRLNREYKRLKEAVNLKRRPTRVVRETATRMELKEIIKEMETEVNDLFNTVKAKDTIIENMQEELGEAKRDSDSLANQYRSKDKQITAQIDRIQGENEKLKNEIEMEKKRSGSLASKIEIITKEKGIDTSSFDKVDTLQAEKKELAIKLEDTEAELTREKSRVEDLSDRLKSIVKAKDELMASNASIQSQKEKIEDEIETLKDKLKKSETKLKELFNKYETSNKELTAAKKEAQQLKTDLTQEKSKLAAIDSRASGVTANSALLQKERDDLKRKLQEANVKIEAHNTQIDKQLKEFSDKENRLKDEYTKKAEIAVKEVQKEIHKDLQSLREEATNYKEKARELNEKLEKSENQYKEVSEKWRQTSAVTKKDKDEWTKKLAHYESQYKSEQRKRERVEKENELTLSSKEEELLQSRERELQLERELRRIQSRLEAIEYEYSNKASNFERDLAKEKHEYEEMSAKYEMLEKDFIAMKSRLVAEKDTLVDAIGSIRKSYDEKLIEIKSLRDALTNRQKDWFNEKLTYQEKIAAMEAKMNRAELTEEEKNRLKELLSEKESLLESYKKEEKHIKEDRDRLRRRVDELASKLTEMERIERSTRTMSITGRTQADKELHECRIKLEHSHTSHKGEVAALHAEYEGRMKMMSDEMFELQRQISTLANQRDQLQRDPALRKGSRLKDDVEDLNAQLYTVRTSLEEALLDNRNMKIQHGTERSAWQIQIAEMRAQINQSEEKILLETRGSTRSYAKTKMELAWDKERQENQRLLQETQRFIQDMRDKLMAIESIREKEKLEARKQLQDLKGVMDSEQEDTHKHVGELQLDLLDLRESHSKLMSQNERLRRERSSYEKEREDWKLTIFAALDIQNKAKDIVTEIEELNKLIPHESEKKDNPESKDTLQVEARVRRRRSVTPAINIEELKSLVEKINNKNEELKRVCVPIKDEDRLRRALTFRHAVSASELMAMQGSAQSLTRNQLPPPNTVIRAPPRPKALAKKCVSLDHTIGMSGAKGSSQERIWDSGDSAQTTPTSSVTNLRIGPYRGFTSYTGYESESSTGGYSYTADGTGSDVSAPVELRSRKSLKERLRIKKTNSIEDSTIGSGVAHAGLTSLALHGLEASPIELAKQRARKEHSLKSRISKTLSKTFSRSSSALEKGEPQIPHKPEKRPTSPSRPKSPNRSPVERSQSPSTTPLANQGSIGSDKPTKRTIFGRIGAKKAEEEAPQTEPLVATIQPLTSKLAVPPTRSLTPTFPRQTRV